MRTIHKIGIGILVGLFFAAGYAARLTCGPVGAAGAPAGSRVSLTAPGTRVAAVGLEGAANVDFQPLQTLLVVVNSVRQHYVEQITDKDEAAMTRDALKAMLASLDDPNSRYVEPNDLRTIEAASEGTFHGIGAVLAVKKIKTGNVTDEHLMVISTMDSGPAAAAGLRTGDDIVAIDGKSVLPFDPYQKASEQVKNELSKKIERSEIKKHFDAEKKRIDSGIPILDAENLLMSQDKKELELSVIRKGSAKETKIKVTPREFTVEPVTSSVMETSKLGYVRINWLCKATGEKFAGALEDMKSKGVKGLVIDLRNLAGGDIDAALAVAKPFASGRTMGTLLKSRGRKALVTVPSASDEEKWREPVIALVDGGTARIPELLAAALKDSGAAKLVGEKTYGDFSHTTLIEERDGSALIFTTGIYLTSKGGNYNGKGVPVDVEVASSPSGDAQLKEAVKLLTAAGGKS